MRIGVLTGGGDCPGLNQAIRGVFLRAADFGHEIVGIKFGWKGILEKLKCSLTMDDMDGIVDEGGTILRTSRTNPAKKDKKTGKDQLDECERNIKEMGLDALVAIGGDDTLGVGAKLVARGVPVVGVPKTMDNDVGETDYTFGYDSAVTWCVHALDSLRDTAKSHQRIMILEVMGRHAGWVAIAAGAAGGADWILIPEVAGAADKVDAAYANDPPDEKAAQAEFDKTDAEIAKMCVHLKALRDRGKDWAVVVVSEGVACPTDTDPSKWKRDGFGHLLLGGAGKYVEEKANSVAEARSIALGHVMRGGPPTFFDRWLGTRFGIKAVDLINEGKWGQMAAIRGTDITSVSMQKAVEVSKVVPLDLYKEVQALWK
jgi:6-phosphofructokinase 1